MKAELHHNENLDKDILRQVKNLNSKMTKVSRVEDDLLQKEAHLEDQMYNGSQGEAPLHKKPRALFNKPPPFSEM